MNMGSRSSVLIAVVVAAAGAAAAWWTTTDHGMETAVQSASAAPSGERLAPAADLYCSDFIAGGNMIVKSQ